MDRREQARIAIFGMGCIGSYTAQLLAKNGVGTLTLADSTMVSLTKKGCYRTSGEPDSMRLRAVTEARRLKRLCPDIHIRSVSRPVTPDSLQLILPGSWDYIIDLLGRPESTLSLAAYARKNQIPLIICLSIQKCCDPARLKLSPIGQTPKTLLPPGLCELFEDSPSSLCRLAYSEEMAGSPQSLRKDNGCSGCACPPSTAMTCPKRRLPDTACSSYVSAMAGMLISEEILLSLTHRKGS